MKNTRPRYSVSFRPGGDANVRRRFEEKFFGYRVIVLMGTDDSDAESGYVVRFHKRGMIDVMLADETIVRKHWKRLRQEMSGGSAVPIYAKRYIQNSDKRRSRSAGQKMRSDGSVRAGVD